MVNPDYIESHCAHLSEIPLHLFTRSKVMPFRVGFERTVSDAFNEELSVAFEEKLRDSANGAVGRNAHSGSPIV